MTQTTQPAGLPATETKARRIAGAEAERRFVLESFETADGENRDPVTGEAPTITLWSVFDVDSRNDGRRGMVWIPGAGFQAYPDHADGVALLDRVRADYREALLAEWANIVNAAPPAPEHTVIRLEVAAGSSQERREFKRLEQLVALYDTAKSAADAAAAALKEITDGIKAEARTLHPGQADLTITSGALAHPLTLQRVISRRFDTAAARRILTGEQYDALCTDSEAWVLKAKKG